MLKNKNSCSIETNPPYFRPYNTIGNLLVRNTTLCFLGQIIPMLLAVFTIPFVIRGLGVERFGIFSLALVIFGYFNLFDFGLGKATTKFIAEALGKKEIEHIPAIAWTSLTIQIILGTIGCLVLLILTPILVENILKIPIYLKQETKLILYILSGAIIVVICSKCFRGILEAGQHFDLINLIQVPFTCLIFLIPVIGIILKINLPSIILLMSISWLIICLIYLLFCFKVLPILTKRFVIERKLLSSLFQFGGWITLSNILIPLLVYFDRFLISAILSISDLTYYTAPYELISRLFFIPVLLSTVLFPVFTTLSSANEKKLIEQLYARSLKYIILVMGPLLVIATVFSNEIIRLWLGEVFVLKCSRVFQIFSIGILLNSLAQIPANLFDALGRPNLRPKVFLSYIFIYIILAWFLIRKFGIMGAALGWLFRAALELLLFFGLSLKVLKIKLLAFSKSGLYPSIVVFTGFILVILLSMMVSVDTKFAKIIITFICIILFTLFVWKYYIIDEKERKLILTKIFPARQIK